MHNGFTTSNYLSFQSFNSRSVATPTFISQIMTLVEAIMTIVLETLFKRCKKDNQWATTKLLELLTTKCGATTRRESRHKTLGE